jgi:hypothetical protein
LTGSASFEEGTGGYGYNAIYIGGTPADRYTPARLSQVPRACRTIMFTDTGFPRKRGLQEYAYCEPWEWVDALGRLRGGLAPPSISGTAVAQTSRGVTVTSPQKSPQTSERSINTAATHGDGDRLVWAAS